MLTTRTLSTHDPNTTRASSVALEQSRDVVLWAPIIDNVVVLVY